MTAKLEQRLHNLEQRVKRLEDSNPGLAIAGGAIPRAPYAGPADEALEGSENETKDD